MASRGFRALLAVFLIWVWVACAGTARAQATARDRDDEGPSDCAMPNHALLTIDASHPPAAYPDLEVCFDRRFDSVVRVKAPDALGCVPNQFDIDDKLGADMSGLSVTCVAVLDKRGLWSSGSVDTMKLGALLHEAGVESLDLYIELPPDMKLACGGGPQRFTAEECFYSYSSVASPKQQLPESISFGYGFDREALATIAIVFGALLVLPLVAVFWFRARAAHVKEADIPSLVFAHRRFMWISTVGGLLFWWLAVDLLHFDGAWRLLATRVAPALADRPVISVLISSLWLVPPFVVLLACSMLSAPLTRLRGIRQTRSQIAWLSIWSVARLFLPVLFFVVAIPLIGQNPSSVLFIVFIFFIVVAWAQRRYAAAMGMVLQSLSAGVLRDRIFEIAAKGKAKLGQIYLMPSEQMRMANAFAHAGRNIFLTDYLLKNLNKGEVDAIVAHEVTHLKSRHGVWRILAVVSIGAVAVLCSTVWPKLIPPNFPIGPLIYGVFLLGVFFVARRNEFSADAGSVKITGDAASLITGLAKVSSLNSMPIHWGKLDEKMLTHPSTLGRIKRLAKLGGIPESEIPQLLARATEPPSDIYEIPPAALSASRIYSTGYKAAASQRRGWIVLAATGLPPAITALAAERGHLSGPPLVICYTLGLVVAIALAITLQNFLTCIGERKLERRLRAKFAKEDGREISRDGILVSVSPGAAPRLFDTTWAWDLGILTFENNLLVYRGEETRFTLRRDEIKSAYLGKGPVGWMKSPTLYIVTASETGTAEVFGVRTWRGASLSENGRLATDLLAQIETWRNSAGTLRGETAPREVRSPKFGTVTSQSPKSIARVSIVIRMFWLDCFAGAALTTLLGFRVGAFETNATAANSNGVVFLYVILTMWITQIVLLLPFWIYREPRPSDGGASPAPVPAQTA
jgi:Zn-dependent protease with chaperone function